MKVLVTGTEGYIGSLLAPYLMERGHDVLGVDTGFYKNGWMYHGSSLTPRTLCKDIRNLEQHDLAGFDAIVHMAELSNDSAGQLDPKITFEINHQGSVKLARLAKSAGIPRFIYTSSCSVYGAATEEIVNESSSPNPLTAYAKCKVAVERDVRQMADDDFSPTFLRNATAFGASPRMRFDLVLNNLAGIAWTEGKIVMISDGTPWRPLVHVLDICQAIENSLRAPRERVHRKILNVGDDGQNYRVLDIAKIVAEVFPSCELEFGPPSSDSRSYRVRFDAIQEALPEFRCKWPAQRGAQQLCGLFSLVDMGKDMFQARPYTRLKQLEYLLKTGQIDGSFYWRATI